VGFEDRLQAPPVLAPGDAFEAALETRGATGRDRKARDRARERDGETDDDDGEVVVGERGRVDLEGPPLDMGESSSSLSPPRCLRVLSSALGGTPVPVAIPRPSRAADGGLRTTMAKRSRGSSRPGQRRQTQRPGQRPVAATTAPASRPAGSLTPEEEARAAELEAQIVAEERAADQSRSRDRSRASGTDAGRVRTREGSLLATRAAEEYQYVVRDVRRIVQVGGGLMLLMFALWLLIEVLNVV
jgi:hypothetical protein